MSRELVYTSARRGLAPGASGFCTVAATEGMERQAVARLESLGAYQFAFGLSDERARLNPVNFAHTRMSMGDETRSVLSRVAFCGADYSGRTNKIAHHVVLEPEEMAEGGPAWMLQRLARSVFVDAWEGEARHLPVRDLAEALGAAAHAPGPAANWERVAGDAGWAGALARAFRERPEAPAFVRFEAGTDVLPLVAESLALLEASERWQVGFATYYASLPSGCTYHWRGVLAGSAAEQEMRRFSGATVIDLTAPLPGPEADEYAEAARAGRIVPRGAEAAATAGGRSGVVGDEKVVVRARPGDSEGAEGASSTGRPRGAAGRRTFLPLVILLLAGNVALTLLLARASRRASEARRDHGEATGQLAEARGRIRALTQAEIERLGRVAQDGAVEAVRAAEKVDEALAAKNFPSAERAGQDARAAAHRAGQAASRAAELAGTIDAPKAAHGAGEGARRAQQAADGASAALSAAAAEAPEPEPEPPAPEPAAPEPEPAGEAEVPPAPPGPVEPAPLAPSGPVEPAPLAPSVKTRDELLGEAYELVAVEADAEEAGVLRFAVGGARAVVNPPGAMAAALRPFRFQTEAGVLTIAAPPAGGLGSQPVMTCRLSASAAGSVLECRPEAGAARCPQLAWLVVELADAQAARICQCPLGRPAPVEAHILLGWEQDADGAWRELGVPSVALRYPWPEKLVIVPATGEEPKALSGESNQALAFDWGEGDGGGGRTVRFVLRVARSGEQLVLAPDFGAALPVVKEAEHLWQTRSELEERLATGVERRETVIGNLPSLSEERRATAQAALNELDAGIAKLKEELAANRQALRNLEPSAAEAMRATARAVALHSSLSVRDGWGLTVARLVLEYGPCDGKTLIESARP